MNIMQSIKEKIASYIDAQLALLKLNAIEKTAALLSYLLLGMLGLLGLFCFLLLLTWAVVECLHALGISTLFSLLLTMLFYMLLLGLVFAFRKPIIRSLSGVFIRALTGNTPKDPKP